MKGKRGHVILFAIETGSVCHKPKRAGSTFLSKEIRTISERLCIACTRTAPIQKKRTLVSIDQRASWNTLQNQSGIQRIAPQEIRRRQHSPARTLQLADDKYALSTGNAQVAVLCSRQ